MSEKEIEDILDEEFDVDNDLGKTGLKGTHWNIPAEPGYLFGDFTSELVELNDNQIELRETNTWGHRTITLDPVPATGFHVKLKRIGDNDTGYWVMKRSGAIHYPDGTFRSKFDDLGGSLMEAYEQIWNDNNNAPNPVKIESFDVNVH